MTHADRNRRWRDRKAGLLPQVATCAACSRRCSGSHGELCSRCWLRTDAGREWQRLRMAAYRLHIRDRCATVPAGHTPPPP
jgi:hypothetical protein